MEGKKTPKVEEAKKKKEKRKKRAKGAFLREPVYLSGGGGNVPGFYQMPGGVTSSWGEGTKGLEDSVVGIRGLTWRGLIANSMREVIRVRGKVKEEGKSIKPVLKSKSGGRRGDGKGEARQNSISHDKKGTKKGGHEKRTEPKKKG